MVEFSSGIPVSSTNKTNRYDIIEILLKAMLNSITPNPNKQNWPQKHVCVVGRLSLIVFAF